MPWYLPNDIKFFKDVTCKVGMGDKKNALVMGRCTWESLGCTPLKNRFNIVVSRTLKLDNRDNVFIVRSFHEAILAIEKMQSQIHDVFAIGGSEIYKEALEHPLFTECFVTQIMRPPFECDTFFPLTTLITNGWHMPISENIYRATTEHDNGIDYCRLKLVRTEEKK